MPKEHVFDVPFEAFQPKPWFSSRAEADAVRVEIREWVSQGHEPHLWRGHTHSPPPASATPVYIGEFSLPAARIKARKWAACPCCSPRDPKFGLEPGKIAWFPEERVIRLMGPDCFRSLNPEGHAVAVANLHKEQQRWRDEVFLLGNLDKVSPAIEALKVARDVAGGLEALRESMAFALQIYGPKLWHHIRTGTLSIEQAEQEIFRGRDGEIHKREVKVVKRFGAVSVALFDPEVRRLSGRFTAVIEKLESIEYGRPDVALKAMTEAKRTETAKILDNGFRRGRELLVLLSERRACLSPTNLGILRSWGRHADSPIHFFISRDGRDLFIGSRPSQVIRIELPDLFDRVVSELPSLAGLPDSPGAPKAIARGRG